MGATNYTHYTDNQIQLANAFKALGHPARIAIIEILSQFECLNLKDINSFIPLSQSNISRHCRELFNAGIIGVKNHYNNSFYHLNIPQIERIVEYLEHLHRKRGDLLPPPIIHLFKEIVIKPKVRKYVLT